MSLKTSELGVGDFVAGTTFVSVLLASSYNWGFFSATNSSFLALLTVEDLIVGATISILPAIGGMVVGTIMGPEAGIIGHLGLVFDSSADISYWKRRFLWIPFGIMALGATVGTVVWYGQYPSLAPNIQLIGYVVSFFLTFYTCLMAGVPRRTIQVLIIVGLLGAAFAIGRSEFHKVADNLATPKSEVVFENGSKTVGPIVRTTASYIFMIDANRLMAWPLSSVASVATPM